MDLGKDVKGKEHSPYLKCEDCVFIDSKKIQRRVED